MPVEHEPITHPAFLPSHGLGPEITSADRHYWDNYIKDYTQISAYSVTKQFIITCLLHNYKKIPISSYKNDIEINFKHYTREDSLEAITNYILNRISNNTIHFISKTSVSGRKIATIAAAVNERPNITFTEDTTTSLYLQTDNSHPVRVFKLTTTEPQTTTYFIISSNQMCQNVYYTCLALVPKWFPDLFKGIDAARYGALIALFKAIGRMNNTEYQRALMSCIDLCYDPEETPIDFSTMISFLQTDIDTQIRNIQERIATHQSHADSFLTNYQTAMASLRDEQHKLTVLLTEPKKDNNNIIEDAKNCKSIVDYVKQNEKHIITIKSKMILDSKAIVTKILAPDNVTAQMHYSINTERARRLFEDLWLKETLQLYFCTTFHKTKNTNVPTSITVPKRTKSTRNTIPNPHLIHYTCYGSNKKLLVDAATNNNLQYYLGALTACNSNLNTGDATVLRRFCAELLSTYVDTPILYDVENKTYITPRERMRSYETV